MPQPRPQPYGRILVVATVDVIIPAYNTAKYLPFALESVGAQDFDDWKIVLVDDGSTDNTQQVIAPFLERFGSRMICVRQENRGLPAARNTAIKSSDSEFLALLDADDVWLPHRLSESLKVFRKRPDVGLVYGGITLIDPEGNPGQSFEGTPLNSAPNITSMIYTREIHLPCPTVTFRRTCIENVGLFDESMRATEDRDLWLRIAQRHNVAFIPKVIAYYRKSPNAMSTDSLRMLTAQVQFIQKNFGSPGCGRRARRIALARAYSHRAEGLSKEGKRADAFLASLKALSYYPLSREALRTSGSLLKNWIAPRSA
jgi:GT2 family glycosyltransferase